MVTTLLLTDLSQEETTIMSLTDSTHHITMLRFVITPPDTNKPYTKPPTENKILEFIKTLGYDEDPHAKITYILTFVATRLCQPWRAILSVLNRSLIGKDSSWDTARLAIIQILWGIVHSTYLDFLYL
ncbi:hypothetical protein Tco_0223727 [Tanacetum coccineum]